MSKTKSRVAEYAGKPTFSIWNLNEDGDIKGDFPIPGLAWQVAKVKIILSHVKDMENFVASFGGEHKKKAKKVKHDDD